MNGIIERCPVFCIADIPASMLNKLLDCTQEMMEQDKREIVGFSEELSDRIVFITTQDLSHITDGASSPTEYFFSPFLGQNLEEIRDWFDANITQVDREGYMRRCFLVLDAQSVQDDTCILVFIGEDKAFQSLRCNFYMAVKSAIVCDIKLSMEEGIMGYFMRSGVTRTRENSKLVENGGMYIEGGEVKVDQSWRDFLKQ